MVQRSQHVGDVVGRALRVVEGAVVVGVRGADVRVVAPGDDEQAAAVLGHRDDDGDVVAHLAPRHGDVDALCRPDGVRGAVAEINASRTS